MTEEITHEEIMAELNQRINDDLAIMRSNAPTLNVPMMVKDILIESKIISLIRILEEKGILSIEDMDVMVAEHFIDTLGQIKKEQTKEMIAKPGKGLLIPGKFGGK